MRRVINIVFALVILVGLCVRCSLLNQTQTEQQTQPVTENSFAMTVSEATIAPTATPAIPPQIAEPTPSQVYVAPSPSPSPTPVSIHITKHPTSETAPEGGVVIFLAKADAYLSVEWLVRDDSGVQVDLATLKQCFPDMVITGDKTEELTLKYIPKDLQGWSVTAVFSDTNGSVETASAGITVTNLFEMLVGSYEQCSGAGAWHDHLYIAADGSFYGHYRDSDMGIDMGPEAQGTIHCCDYKGRFGNVKWLGQYAYSFEIISFEQSAVTAPYVKEGTWINPIESMLRLNETIYVYLPQRPCNAVPPGILSWAMLRSEEEQKSTSPTGHLFLADTIGDRGWVWYTREPFSCDSILM